jgi:hypothetical protein
MGELNVLMGQVFKHMAGSEEGAKKIVEDYRKEYDIKKSSVQRKVKKGLEHWIVTVEVSFISEKDAFDQNFGE